MQDNTLNPLQIKINKARGKLPKETLRSIDAVPWKNIILTLRMEKKYSFTQLEDLEIETELLLCGLTDMDKYPKELGDRMNLPKEEVDKLLEWLNEKIFSRIREEFVKITLNKKPSDMEMEKETAVMGKIPFEQKKPEEMPAKAPERETLETREEILKEIERSEEKPEEKEPAEKKLEVENYKLEITDGKGKEGVSPIRSSSGVLDPALAKSVSSGVKKTSGEKPEKARAEKKEAEPEVKDKLPSMFARKLSEKVKTETVESDHSLTGINQTQKTGVSKIKTFGADPYREIPE